MYTSARNNMKCLLKRYYLCTCVGSNGIEVAFTEKSFLALESSEQLMVTISVLEDVENVFDLNVIPTAKYPLDAEGMTM